MSEATSEAFALDAFEFDGVHADPSALQLSSPRGKSALEPKVMALLVALAKRPQQLWQRGELLEAIWPNGLGSDEGLSRVVSLLRKTLKVDHGIDDVVTTVPKLGYRFNASVKFAPKTPAAARMAPSPLPDNAEQTAPIGGGHGQSRLYLWIALGLIVAFAGIELFVAVPPSLEIAFALIIGFAAIVLFAAARTSPAKNARAATLSDNQISLAVLPIESMGGVEDRLFLADGLTRDLTAALARVPKARVAPYSSTRLLTGASASTAAGELDVRYVVTGTIAAQSDQLVLRIDLTDAAGERQIWSKRFIEPLQNFFALQEKAVVEISASIFSEIHATEIASVRDRDEFDLSVYELLQKAESERYRYGREPALQITSFLQRALAIDPTSNSARAALATQLAQNVISGFSADPENDASLALTYLDEIRAIAPRDPQVLTATGMVQYYINGDLLQAKRLLEQSLQIDPNEPHAAVILGLLKCYTGQSDEGLELIRNSEVRAPRDPRFGIWAWFRSAGHSVNGEIAEAKAAANEAIDRNPNYPPFHYALAHYESLLGNVEAAQAAVGQARRLDAGFGQEDYERLLSTAGYPGVPDKSREEVFQLMRACIAGEKVQ